jgi:hypothetical protein
MLVVRHFNFPLSSSSLFSQKIFVRRTPPNLAKSQMTPKNKKPTNQFTGGGALPIEFSFYQLIRSLPLARRHTHTTQTATRRRLKCHLVESVHVKSIHRTCAARKSTPAHAV